MNDNIVSGWDIVNDNDVTTDDTAYHGTAVAGIIGAVGNSSVRVGVNWDVSLVPIQASKTDAIFSLADCVKAVKWAKDKWGTSEQIDIINFSVGEFGISTAVRDMVKDYQRFVCLVSR